MSIEIIREGHKPDTKLYFTCKCGCVWKADKKDCEKEVLELQIDFTVEKLHYNCPTCGRYCTGMTRKEYADFEVAQSGLHDNPIIYFSEKDKTFNTDPFEKRRKINEYKNRNMVWLFYKIRRDGRRRMVRRTERYL